jgi:nucleoside-diphosphate-sugar epimerase
LQQEGRDRAREIATTLMDEVKAGNLGAMIARAADFYGPNTKNGVPNVLVFEAFAKGSTASWLVNATVPHSLTFIPDAARGVAMLAERDSAFNQVWHLPTAADPPTGQEFIEMAAAAFGVKPKYRVLSKPLLRVVGWFDPRVRESYEMLYQSAHRTSSIRRNSPPSSRLQRRLIPKVSELPRSRIDPDRGAPALVAGRP